jgi:hypothetical protein
MRSASAREAHAVVSTDPNIGSRFVGRRTLLDAHLSGTSARRYLAILEQVADSW